MEYKKLEDIVEEINNEIFLNSLKKGDLVCSVDFNLGVYYFDSVGTPKTIPHDKVVKLDYAISSFREVKKVVKVDNGTIIQLLGDSVTWLLPINLKQATR